jgi:hypothetical protein
MAAPTLPDRDALAAEVASRSGDDTAAASEFYDYFEEIKAEISSLLPHGVMKSLMKTKVTVPPINRSHIPLPSDFALMADFGLVNLSMLTGDTTGAFQAGSTTSSLVLASDETTDDSLVIRNRILVTSGGGIGGIGDVYSYNTSTKTALVDPPLNNGAPSAADTYLIVNKSVPIDPFDFSVKSNDQQNLAQGDIKRVYLKMNASGDGFVFVISPVPSSLYGLELTYPTDITQIDLTGNLLSRLYQTWRNLWVQGALWRKLQKDNDGGYIPEREHYLQMLQLFSGREIMPKT